MCSSPVAWVLLVRTAFHGLAVPRARSCIELTAALQRGRWRSKPARPDPLAVSASPLLYGYSRELLRQQLGCKLPRVALLASLTCSCLAWYLTQQAQHTANPVYASTVAQSCQCVTLHMSLDLLSADTCVCCKLHTCIALKVATIHSPLCLLHHQCNASCR